MLSAKLCLGLRKKTNIQQHCYWQPCKLSWQLFQSKRITSTDIFNQEKNIPGSFNVNFYTLVIFYSKLPSNRKKDKIDWVIWVDLFQKGDILILGTALEPVTGSRTSWHIQKRHTSIHSTSFSYLCSSDSAFQLKKHNSEV